MSYGQRQVAEASLVIILCADLKAWDKNHENAQNRGNTLRKELERLHKDKVTYEDKMDEIIKSVDI